MGWEAMNSIWHILVIVCNAAGNDCHSETWGPMTMQECMIEGSVYAPERLVLCVTHTSPPMMLKRESDEWGDLWITISGEHS